MRSIVRALVMAVLLASPALAPMGAQAGTECEQRGPNQCGTVVGGDGAITWVYAAESGAFYGFHNHGQRASDKNAYFLVPACGANVPTADDPWGGDEFCGAAGTACPDGILFWIYSRPISIPDVVPTHTGDECITPDLVVPVDTLRAAVTGDLQSWLAARRFATPTVWSDPAEHALVRLPSIFWTQPVAPVALTVTAPFPATVDIEPQVRWSFGESGSAPDNAGAPFDGTDPRTDPGHYPVTHVYEHSGSFTVAVAVTWRATVLHVPGVGVFPVSASVTATSAPRRLTVHDARAVLVGS